MYCHWACTACVVGFLDRLAVALRPSLLTVLLLLVTGVGLAVGGTGTAAVLLLLAYSLYRWASSVSQPDGQYGDGTAEAPAGASHEGGELQEEESAEGFYEPGYENEFAQGFEGSSLSAAGAGEFEDIEPEQSSMHAGDPEVSYMCASKRKRSMLWLPQRHLCWFIELHACDTGSSAYFEPDHTHACWYVGFAK